MMRPLVLGVCAWGVVCICGSALRAQEEDCATAAERLREQCLMRGNTEEECQQAVDEFLATCEEPPAPPDEPPPAPECEEACSAVGERIKMVCSRMGKTDAECAAAVEAAVAACLENCTARAAPPDCETACQMRADAIESGCLAEGEDEETCSELAAAHLDMCLGRCDGVPPACPDRCGAVADRVEEECLAAGGDEATCEARADRVQDACLRGCERLPPPACPARCALEARDALAECLEGDGDPAECRAQVEEGLRECIATCDGTGAGEPPPPPSAEERCAEVAERVRMGCVDEGGDPAACDERAEEFLERCLERRAAVEVPAPPACVDACSEPVQGMIDDCIAEGGDPEECRIEAQRMRAECIRQCERPFPPDCESRCDSAVDGLRRSCEARGLTEEECDERIATFLAACTKPCDTPPPAPPTCEERCARATEAMRSSCLEAGGDPAECDAKADEFSASCIDRCENPPSPPSCDERCADIAERRFAACVAEGGDEDECRADADDFLDVCLTRCNVERPLPCDERCAQIARAVMSRCQEAGLSEEECAERSNRILENCARGCDRPEPPSPPGPPPCGERCQAAADRLAAACAERGGSEDECSELVAKFLERCTFRCEDENGGDNGDGGGASHNTALSGQLCAEKAREIEDDCVVAGMDSSQCALLSLDFAESCAVDLGHLDDWFEMADLAPPRPFIRADSNRDGDVNLSDPINTLNGMFLGTGNAFGTRCLDRLDANDDGRVDVSDPIFTLLWLFAGGGAPPAPGPHTAGQDATADLEVCFD